MQLARRLSSALVVIAAASLAPGAAAQQGFPSKPIKLVVTVNPGNTGDTRSRQIAEKLGPLLGGSVVVENRPGASGNIAAEYVARAPADGHTILMGHVFNMTWNPALLKMSFEPVKVLTGITLVSAGPPLLVAHPSMPFNTVGEMIAYAKANPGKLNMGGTTGGVAHVVTEMMKQSTGANITFVPYKAAGGQITTDLVSNVIQVYFDWTVTLQQLINTGRVKPLGVAADKRLPVVPNIPTFAESGYPGGLDVPSWQGFYAPVGTPREILARIAAETAKVLNMPEIRNAFESTGAVIGGNTPEQFQAFTLAEHERWGKVIRQAGIRLD
ncbi:MAG: tripartite tricarboxylate transporter substrate binding protein [Burkholderiales bacterium]|nr:tripartite tricarboxylate transporter substrate binding protein [Burkholderiales bacterium]